MKKEKAKLLHNEMKALKEADNSILEFISDCYHSKIITKDKMFQLTASLSELSTTAKYHLNTIIDSNKEIKSYYIDLCLLEK